MSNRIQLFCIPYAGGSSTSFNKLSSYLDEFIDVYIVEYSGRGIRNKESYITNIKDLINDTKRQIEEYRNTNTPFAILGYSMGTAIAFDLIQYVLDEKPVHFFSSAREALFHYIKSQEYALLTINDFMKEIQKLGGIDDRIINNKRFLDIYIRPVYANYKLWSQYKYNAKKGKLCCDITVFYNERDTPFEHVKGWETMTSGYVDFHEYGDNHFFIQTHTKEMANIINEKLSMRFKLK